MLVNIFTTVFFMFMYCLKYLRKKILVYLKLLFGDALLQLKKYILYWFGVDRYKLPYME